MESRWIWPFELLDKLGEGGMGVVYRARYVGNDRQVAVKLLPPGAASNQTLLARFEREMDVLKQLRHPNIVHCFGGTCESKQWFYAMELIDGGSLADIIKQEGRLSWEVAIDYAIQMCDALEFAHNHGVIHRDVKPANFLITKQGQLKLSDFGLVTVVAGHRLTATGRTLGTADYMSPEQIRGKPPLTNRSDLYALGCVLYEMLTGKPPYAGETSIEVMHKHLNEPIPHVARVDFRGPLELDQLVCELLAKKPEQRPDSAAAVKSLLEDILQPGRRFQSIEQTLFPTASTANTKNTKIAPLKGVRISSDAHSTITRIMITSHSIWLWSLAACMIIICLIGWGKSSSRLRVAEQALVEQLKSTDESNRVFAANTLSRFTILDPATISELHQSVKNGPDAIKIASLKALAQHASECRQIQWEIYKLQKDTDISSAVRNQAELTFNAMNQVQSGSALAKISFWVITSILMVAAIVAGWWLWRQMNLVLPDRRSPATFL